jgi:hypothetical protein
LAAASIVTSFLGGQALVKPALQKGEVVSPPIGLAGWLAIAAFVVVALAVTLIVWPYKWRFVLGPTKILEGGAKASGNDAVHSALAGFLDGNWRTNRSRIDLLVLYFRVECLALLAETVLWLVDLRT